MYINDNKIGLSVEKFITINNLYFIFCIFFSYIKNEEKTDKKICLPIIIYKKTEIYVNNESYLYLICRKEDDKHYV